MKSIRNNIHRLLLIKILKSLHGNVQHFGNFLQQGFLHGVFLFEEGDFLLVPVFAEVEGFLLDASISLNRLMWRLWCILCC